MNRTKVILSIFLMLFLLLAGLVLPSFWKSQKKEASGNKGREPAKETTETNSDTPMPEYLDFDALKAFFSDSQIASLKGQFPVYLKEYVKKEQTSITFLPEKTSYPTETTVCLMFHFPIRIRFRLPITPRRVCFYLEKTGYRSLQIRLFTKSKPMIPCRP